MAEKNIELDSVEVAAAVFDFKYNESRDASDFKAYCVAYMVSSRYGVDTRGFNFDRLPKEYAEMETQDFKGELGSMRDVLGEVQSHTKGQGDALQVP